MGQSEYIDSNRDKEILLTDKNKINENTLNRKWKTKKKRKQKKGDISSFRTELVLNKFVVL